MWKRVEHAFKLRYDLNFFQAVVEYQEREGPQGTVDVTEPPPSSESRTRVNYDRPIDLCFRTCDDMQSLMKSCEK